MSDTVICGMANSQSNAGAYTEAAFLAKINADSDMKHRCKTYKKLTYMGPGCPSDRKDVKGWMKHFGASYRSRSDCTRRIKRKKAVGKKIDPLYVKRNKCYTKNGNCKKIEDEINRIEKQYRAMTY
jgi:hypothetical protein